MTPEQRAYVETRKAIRAADAAEKANAEMAEMWAESHAWVASAFKAQEDARRCRWQSDFQQRAHALLEELDG